MNGQLNNVFDLYTVIKLPLKNIMRKISYDDIYTKDILDDAILRTNNIVVHVYSFLKLLFIHLYDKNLNFPIIDYNLINCIVGLCSNAGNLSAFLRKIYIKLYFLILFIQKIFLLNLSFLENNNY